MDGDDELLVANLANISRNGPSKIARKPLIAGVTNIIRA